MAGNIGEPTSVPLYQIMGAPLLALVQAETQAAQATAEFIEQVGFEKKSINNSTDQPDLGDLRTVVFRYSKIGGDGQETIFEVHIPLLSLIPIPALQVRDAEVDFAVQIHDVMVEEARTKVHAAEATTGTFLAADRVGFRAGLGKRDSDYAMHIKISIGQAEPPVGLLTLFRVMEQGITSRVKPVLNADSTTTTTTTTT